MTGTEEEQDHPPLPDGIDRTGSGGSNGTAFNQKKRMDLADLLRDCAALVEQNEMDQKVFQRMFRELTEYVSGHGGVKPPDSSVPKRSSNAAAATAAATTATSAAAAAEPVAASSQTPFDEPPPASAEPAVQNTSSRNVAQEQHQQPYAQATPPPSARKVTTTTTKHIPPPSSSRSVNDQHHQISKEKNIKFFDKIKHAAKEAGQEFSNIAHTGQQALSSAAKKATSAKNAQRVREDLANEFGGDDWHEERRANYQERNAERRSSTTSTSERNNSDSRPPPNPSKPPFQRPVNPNSTLIANGWLEQQRRSKMRFVWKEVLVSLVAGRRPGEETTLWVQRETTNPVTGNMGLEALHQIPIKGMQDINYVDFSTDHRFIIQVYNLSDEFVFRTRDNGDAAKNWVSTLRLTREAVLNGVAPPKPGDLQTQRTKTHPSYSGEDEKKAESPPQQQHQHHHQQQGPPQQQQAQQQQHPRKMAVKELRAIAHAHGVNTAGMERSQLEAAVARIQQQSEGRATPAAGGPPAAQRAGSEDESERELRRRQMRKDEETAARYAAEERDRAEAERRRMAEAEEQRRRQQHAEYLRQQEILRQQQAQQQAQAAAQMRAEEERRRYQQQQQYYAQQQAQAQAQAQAAAQQQYYAQQQAAQQQYYAQQQAQQQQNFHTQQAPPPGGHPHAPPPQAHQGPPPGQQQQGQQPHGNPNKWANIIAGDDPEKEEEAGQAAITAIKHHILIQWALQPPTMQVLRPIHGLLTTVHTVFPPTQGVPGHEYFKKWKTVSMDSLSDESGQPDENKLAKAVKKLRFFLHPDKLPRDLNEEQSFVCKMLWDVTSDAWEEYEKQKEQLDWLNQPAA